MELTGLLLRKLRDIEGKSEKTGMPWRNAEFLLETVGEYPHKAKFKVRDGQYNLIARFENLIGKVVTVSFEIEASESKNKGFWFNELRAWGIIEYKPEQLTAEESMKQQAAGQTAQPAGDAAGTVAEPRKYAKEGGSFDELMQKDAVAAQAKMLGEFQEHGTCGDDLPF